MRILRDSTALSLLQRGDFLFVNVVNELNSLTRIYFSLYLEQCSFTGFHNQSS